MAINELDLSKCCPTCGGQYDKENNQFIVRCGPPIQAYEYSGKVCFFAKKRGEDLPCMNPLNNEKPSWESFDGLDKKSEKVLVEYGISEESLNYLKQSGSKRYDGGKE
jgi:hypothetical protein